jgi:hypothetical protein
MDAHGTINESIAAIRPPDERAREAARALQLRLTKPAGALVRLEELHVWTAGVLRDSVPELRRKVIVVAAADHGIAAEGVSAHMLTLILGGACSGKSDLAERLATASGRPVLFVTTMEPGDDETRARIAAHRAQRPAPSRSHSTCSPGCVRTRRRATSSSSTAQRSG